MNAEDVLSLDERVDQEVVCLASVWWLGASVVFWPLGTYACLASQAKHTLLLGSRFELCSKL